MPAWRPARVAAPFPRLRALTPRPALAALVLAVVAMHAGVLWLMLLASRPHVRQAGPTKRIAMEVVQVVPVPKAELPGRPTGTPRMAAAAAAPRTPVRRAAPVTRSDVVTASPSAPAAPVAKEELSQPIGPPPAPLILNSDATRRALRDVARQRSFADRANQDLQGPAPSTFDSKLSAGVAGAAHGDCMKGQFKGNNMGLLSLPALAIAAASGECAR